jgi:calcium-translocating P-type ATPase
MRDYQKPLEELFRDLEADPDGLSTREAAFRLEKYGFNRLRQVKGKPWIIRFFLQFTDLLAIILIVAGFLAFIVAEPRDGIIIFSIVFINAIIGFVQEFKAERILAAFKKHLPSFSKVIRGGKLHQVLTWELVPGDILDLETGDSIGADARMIEAYDFKANQFSLTGESTPQTKKTNNISEDRVVADIDNMVFMGTSVAQGSGKAVVVNTGMETEFGKIARESLEVKELATPLQKELTHTGKLTAFIAGGVAVFVLVLFYLLGRGMQETLLFAIAAACALVPEGLPAAMSIALSLGAQRMLKKKALVKKLVHVESLGSVTTICTDKTGTLTTGEMTLVEKFPREFDKRKKRRIFLRALSLCNNASISKNEEVGDQVDIALLKYAITKINLAKVKRKNKKVFEVPFSSERKMVTVVCSRHQSNIAYAKGAPQVIIAKCNLDDDERRDILNANDKMAKRGLKVLAVAYKKLGEEYKKHHLEENLKFLSLVGLHDPPRRGVREAIRLCRKARIKIHMVTGDYGLTALSIAKEIGLAGSGTEVITGEDLHQMDDERLKKVLEEENIFARIDPTQKLRIVDNLQEMKEVVAVTGDGVNDVPALVKADIGIAMGKIGTDVAKEASDMILLDDHFATIVNAVAEGRRIFDNAKKFVFYVFSSNSGELFTPFIGIILGLPLPLIAVQILAIDLGTDVFPSLALGVEKEEEGVMEHPPRSKVERIMNLGMLAHLLAVGLVMAVLALSVYLITLYLGGWHWGQPLFENSLLYFKATAAVYATLVSSQTANAFSCRSERESIFKIGIFSNKWLIYAEIISAVLLWMMMDFPPINHAFHTSNPPLLSWLMIFASFFIFLIIFETRKAILRRREA